MRWLLRRRRTYRVVQLQNGERHVLLHGLRRKEAVRNAERANVSLGLLKLMAPSGPQDAHAVIEEEEVRS